MSQAERFLFLAGRELIEREGVRLVKAPPRVGAGEGWSPGWGEWDEVLIGDGPGVRPALFLFKLLRDPNSPAIRSMYDALIHGVTSGQIIQMAPASQIPLRLIVVFCFDSVDPAAARRLSSLVPDRYYAGLKPEVWVADLAQQRLWAPRTFGVLPSRAQTAVRQALKLSAQSDDQVNELDLVQAEARSASQRQVFVSAMRKNVPYVTYAYSLPAGWSSC